MTLTPDEQKVLVHRAQERKREAFQRQLLAELHAPAEPAATTKKNWSPLTETGRIVGQNG